MQHAMDVRHIVMLPAPLYTIFPHQITSMIFEKGKNLAEHKLFVLIFWTTFV
jgi:hypothetical protein